MQWPAHYPPDCPPDQAMPADGPVYRLVDGAVITEWDFRSHCLRQPDQEFANPCQASGLSVFRDREGVETMRKTYYWARMKRVAYCILRPEHGLLARTPSERNSYHCTWWVPEGVCAQDGFELLPE